MKVFDEALGPRRCGMLLRGAGRKRDPPQPSDGEGQSKRNYIETNVTFVLIYQSPFVFTGLYHGDLLVAICCDH